LVNDRSLSGGFRSASLYCEGNIPDEIQVHILGYLPFMIVVSFTSKEIVRNIIANDHFNYFELKERERFLKVPGNSGFDTSETKDKVSMRLSGKGMVVNAKSLYYVNTVKEMFVNVLIIIVAIVINHHQFFVFLSLDCLLHRQFSFFSSQ